MVVAILRNRGQACSRLAVAASPSCVWGHNFVFGLVKACWILFTLSAEGEYSEEEEDDDDDEEDEEDDLRDKKHVAPKRPGDTQDEQPGAKKPHHEFPENKSTGFHFEFNQP